MPHKTVKLISADGFEFIVDYQAAIVSKTIKNMLSSTGSYTETETGEVRFGDISAPILEKVCQYFYFRLRHEHAATKTIPEFKFPPEMALELLRAANYLDT
jgi:transcription elongation factor B subunit 1